MEIKNASVTSSTSNQMRHVFSVRWEFRNITPQPWVIGDRKSKVFAFVIKAGIHVNSDNFYI